MRKNILAILSLFTLAACGLFEEKPDTGNPSEPKPEKICLHFKDEATKAAIIAEHGKSCKIGDYWGIGDEKCSSSLQKCLDKN